MERVVERDGKALQRIVALLLALADIADRADSLPFPVRVVVLAILRHAEAVAWAFALGAMSVPSARGRSHQLQGVTPCGVLFAGDHGPVEAARLSVSLRVLAILLANRAIRELPSSAMPSIWLRTGAPERAHHLPGWRGARALPPPDTS